LLLTLLALCIGTTKGVWASGFHLKSIGNVETGGRQISHWWYSGSDVVFHGEALPGAEVVVDIDGAPLQINADSAGNWDFKPQSSLTAGDHQITLTSGESIVKFTLTTGAENVNWEAVGSGQAETMPTVGTSWPTVLLTLVGLLSIGWGGKMIANVDKG
jgi:hypothetical protein